MDLSDCLPFVHLDDEQFQLALFELKNGSLKFSHGRLESMFVNPIVVENSITTNSDLDPDSHFLALQQNSQYLTPDQF